MRTLLGMDFWMMLFKRNSKKTYPLNATVLQTNHFGVRVPTPGLEFLLQG